MEKYYQDALKKGRKQYKKDVSKGGYPHLTALSEELENFSRSSIVNIGLVQVPAGFIVGTVTTGRANMFASNFMPLADEESEFAGKWIRLCNSHLEEGIRDAVTVYEYMNRFYVIEGNKRVSVLKYFDAVSILAEVKRVMPERNGDPEVELYYEYLDFNKETGINYIEFSQHGAYREFMEMMGWSEDKKPDEKALRKLKSDFYFFEKVFNELAGRRIEVTSGDALLVFLKLFGADSISEMSTSEIRNSLIKIWQEVLLKQEDSPVGLITAPEEKEPGLLDYIIPKPRQKVKAAFLYRTDIDNSDWVADHEKGRLQVMETFNEQLETVVKVCPDDESCEAAIKEVIEQGYTVIFATSIQMEEACLKAAIENPQVDILISAIHVSHRYIRSYFPRMYEAKFISGAIAGNISANGKIGYICKYPVYGSIAEINAFARGVQLTNANAKVYLEWSTESSAEDKMAMLIGKGVDIVSVRDHIRPDDSNSALYGLNRIEKDKSITNLMNVVWKWGPYYELIIRSIINGTFKSQGNKTARSLNYYWGMSAGVADVEFSESLPRGARYLGELIRYAIVRGKCFPFYDPKRDEAGNFIWEDVHASMDVEDIVEMNWLEDNIEGEIPAIDKLRENAREFVAASGVKPMTEGDSE